MTKDDFLDYAREHDKDMVQVTTLLELAPEVPMDRLLWIFSRYDNGPHQWLAKPERGMPNGFVDRRGNVWRFPFEGHSTFATLLGFGDADSLRAVGWLHVSNDYCNPHVDYTMNGDCYGNPMTRAQQRTVDKLWPTNFEFDDYRLGDLPRPSPDVRERIAQIEATYGKVRRALAKEGYTQ